jgi:hypothetical protein
LAHYTLIARINTGDGKFSTKTYLGYRNAVNLFVTSCKKIYFDQIRRDDMLDFLYYLRTRVSRETGKPMASPPCSITSSKQWFS